MVWFFSKKKNVSKEINPLFLQYGEQYVSLLEHKEVVDRSTPVEDMLNDSVLGRIDYLTEPWREGRDYLVSSMKKQDEKTFELP
jgi:hypothetical protein